MIKHDLPDVDNTKAQHRALYAVPGRNMKSVAVAAGSSSTAYSRRMNENETTVYNPIHEVIAEMTGAVNSGQPEIGKGVFQMIYRPAAELGLVNEHPVDIARFAIDRLRAVSKSKIEAMSPDEQVTLQALTVELDASVGVIKKAVVAVKQAQETQIRSVEFHRPSRNGAG
jgi:hypothetical protein